MQHPNAKQNQTFDNFPGFFAHHSSRISGCVNVRRFIVSIDFQRSVFHKVAYAVVSNLYFVCTLVLTFAVFFIAAVRDCPLCAELNHLRR